MAAVIGIDDLQSGLQLAGPFLLGRTQPATLASRVLVVREIKSAAFFMPKPKFPADFL